MMIGNKSEKSNKKVSKKAQAAQMFQYITTLVVVGMVALIGFGLVNKLTSTGEDIDYVRFRNTLVDTIDSVASDYNARQDIEVPAPKGVKQICFIDMKKQSPNDVSKLNPVVLNYWNDIDYKSQIVQNQETSKLVRNVFLLGESMIGSFHVDDLNFDESPYFFCTNSIKSKFLLTVSTKGRTVSISPQE